MNNPNSPIGHTLKCLSSPTAVTTPTHSLLLARFLRPPPTTAFISHFSIRTPHTHYSTLHHSYLKLHKLHPLSPASPYNFTPHYTPLHPITPYYTLHPTSPLHSPPIPPPPIPSFSLLPSPGPSFNLGKSKNLQRSYHSTPPKKYFLCAKKDCVHHTYPFSLSFSLLSAIQPPPNIFLLFPLPPSSLPPLSEHYNHQPTKT